MHDVESIFRKQIQLRHRVQMALWPKKKDYNTIDPDKVQEVREEAYRIHLNEGFLFQSSCLMCIIKVTGHIKMIKRPFVGFISDLSSYSAQPCKELSMST